jgi:hydrogenase nickel incorporation protein HypA/HybF
MHESSIIEYVLQIVESAAKSNGMTKVTEIDLVIGKMRAALPVVLKYTFKFLSGDAMFDGAKLNIEERDIIIRCDGCGKETTIDSAQIVIAPCCESQRIRILQGNELIVSSFNGF